MTGSLPGVTAGNMDLKPDKDSALYRSDEENKCQEAALRLLDAAPRSSGSLRTRLIAKGYEEETVGKVIRRLVSSRLIDDGQYARSMVQYCLSRFLGEYGTRQELRKKEVEGPLITAVVEEAREAGKFENSAYELALKVSKKTSGLDTRTRLRRFWSACARKGHDPDTIRRYTDILCEDSEGLENEE
ncbi:MAG: regulatory protein RecX [Scardovia wiggsiae]